MIFPKTIKEFVEFIEKNETNYYLTMAAWNSIDKLTLDADQNLVNKGCKILQIRKKKIRLKDLVEYLQTLNPEAKLEVEEYQSCMTDSGTDMGGSYNYPMDVVDLENKVVFKKAD